MDWIALGQYGSSLMIQPQVCRKSKCYLGEIQSLACNPYTSGSVLLILQCVCLEKDFTMLVQAHLLSKVFP